MYLEFYQLKEWPFSLTSDERFFYESSVHAETLSNMLYTVQNRKGMVLITGDIGTGKTFLANVLAARLGPESVVVQMQNPPQSGQQLLRLTTAQVGLRGEPDRDKASMLEDLEKHLVKMANRHRLVVLILDEAQDLPDDCLNDLRLLTNWEHDGQRLLQIVLVGQPELREKLLLPQWEPLRQRIVLSYQLGHLSADDVSAYIDFRISVAGEESCLAQFTDDAKADIYAATAGVPRLINVLCDNALLIGENHSAHRIDRQIVSEVLKDMPQWHVKPEETVESEFVAEDALAEASAQAVERTLAGGVETPSAFAESSRPAFRVGRSRESAIRHREEAPIMQISSQVRFPELIVAHNDRGSSITEEYRTLRTSLLGASADERFCFLVTSAEPGEGKSVTCINLAMVMLERADFRTVIVDFDLRRGALADYFNTRATPGVADLLRGTAHLKEVVQPTAYPNLFFLPAGHARPEEIGELLGSPEIEPLVTDLRRQYDYVILDTPPINTVPDAGMIGLAAGEALVVVRMNKTRRELVDKAIRLLHAANVKVSGIILTNRKHFLPQAMYR